ncbi:hypothetical protein FXO38_09956 [Capsicum annuum]|uniref:uncharacterized protein LOC107843018 isoform X2 n=1 Tax=Capsicum annuum TaxID=4072 RepID=UPI0007BF3AF8|nr:uncharacterized protein LOC107843018 isoform X2 [Capsicum annuum]KAF3664750.1 hypothetical protein FXO38_09956 [Capsicum annuum]
MEKSRHRKSRSASGIMEGSKLVQKQIARPKVTLNSRSYCDGTARGDMTMLDLGKGSSKRVTGTPIKKLLDEEMAKEGESKRRPPSIVARLMGLEGMPSPQHIGRQQRRFSDSCQHRNEQIDPRRRRQLFDEQSSKRSSMEHQEFKDVYEDLEASHVANRRHSSRWSETGIFGTPDLALIQQKFMDAKRLSTDERFQNSKEFDDILEALESKKELLLKYLQEPDSLFMKHLQDLQAGTASSTCSQIAVLKPSKSVKYEGSVKSCKSSRGTSCKHGINFQKERLDGLLLQSQHCHSGHNSQKSSPVVSEGKEENILPTRIVVLKPNLGITQTDITSIQYHPDARKHAQHPCASPGGAGLEEEKNSSKNMGIVRPKSNEARDVAKEITRRMQDSFGPFDGRDAYFRGSGVKGYAGDESSCDVYESDSTGESDITTLSSRKSSGRGNLKKSSSLGSSESSVGKEAKKRLSERWKMSQYYQDVEVACKSSTLGEMLSLPDGGTERDCCDNTMVHVEEAISKSGGRKGTTEWDFPLGISSRDGWKDLCINDSSGCRSTSPSFCSKKHRTRARREVFSNKQYSIFKEPVDREQSVTHRRSRSLDGMLNLRDEFLSKDSRSSQKKVHSSRLGSDSSPKGKLCQRIDMSLGENLDLHSGRPGSDSSPKGKLCQRVDMSLGENLDKLLSEMLLLVSQVPSADGVRNINASDDAETESITLASEYSVEMLPKLPSECVTASPLNQQVSILQDSLPEPSPAAASVVLEYPVPEPESSVSSKEADHPSPLSVLEVPFTEDASSGSECFERVSAGLDGLRMQLKLLKMESEVYVDVVASDDEVESFEDNCSLRSQSWQSFYILDVLTDSGLKTSDPDAFLISCHSLECPLSPWIFNNLEKKYTDETTGSRYERKLLFDRINLGLVEILRKYVDPCPWVKPIEGINWKWQTYGMKNILHQLLKSHEDPANKDTHANIVEDMHWLELKEEVDLIGKDIEKSLIEDLIEELVAM